MWKVRMATLLMAASLAASMMILTIPAVLRASRQTERTANVQVIRVTSGELERTLRVQGRLRGMSEYMAVSPVNGMVAQVYVVPGEAVAKGKALYRMDSTVQTAAVSNQLGAALGLPELEEQADTWPIDKDAAVMAYVNERSDTMISQAAETLAACTVRAPEAGIVQQVLVGEHSVAAVGSPGVLLSSEEQRIVCTVSLRDAEDIRAGMQARIVSGGEEVCRARVDRIEAASIDQETGRTVSAVTLMADRQLDLPLGAPVDAEIILAQGQQASILPVSAVSAQETVWWVSNNRAYEVPVTVLMANEQDCWVNLPEGLPVIADGSGLTEGQRVRVTGP